MKYSIIPARVMTSPLAKRFKIGHYNVLCVLGAYANKEGLVFCTVETIENHSPHVRRETIKNAMKDLIHWGFVRKLEKKYIKNQKSPWLTSRYQLVYTEDMPVPKLEELEKTIVSEERQDPTFADPTPTPTPASNREEELTLIRDCVAMVTGQCPNYALKEYVLLQGEHPFDQTRETLLFFVSKYVKHYRKQPTLKEILYGTVLK